MTVYAKFDDGKKEERDRSAKVGSARPSTRAARRDPAPRKSATEFDEINKKLDELAKMSAAIVARTLPDLGFAHRTVPAPRCSSTASTPSSPLRRSSAASGACWSKAVDRDEVLCSRNATKLMMPASTMKVVTLRPPPAGLGLQHDPRLHHRRDRERHPQGDLICRRIRRSEHRRWDGAATQLFADWPTQLKARASVQSAARSSATTTCSTTTDSFRMVVGRHGQTFPPASARSSSTKARCS